MFIKKFKSTKLGNSINLTDIYARLDYDEIIESKGDVNDQDPNALIIRDPTYKEDDLPLEADEETYPPTEANEEADPPFENNGDP